MDISRCGRKPGWDNHGEPGNLKGSQEIFIDCVFLTSLVIGYNYVDYILDDEAIFPLCYRQNYLLEKEVPRKFQILSHPGTNNDPHTGYKTKQVH